MPVVTPKRDAWQSGCEQPSTGELLFKDAVQNDPKAFRVNHAEGIVTG